MRLRGRLALVAAASAIALVAVAGLAMEAFWDHFAVHTLREVVLYRMENGGRAECETDPAAFALPRGDAAHAAPEHDPARGHHRPARAVLAPAAQHAQVFAYSDAFVSANPAAPPFPASLREELASGEPSSHVVVDEGDRRVLVLGVRTPWPGGPCALLLARQELRSDLRAMHDLVVGSATVALGLVVAVLLAAGPAVARIRALSAGVRRAAADRWATPVEVRGRDEIADLARSFNEAGAELRRHVEALERRERTLREFVANTDHDLTIPLTVLLGHLADLRRRAEAGEPPDPARLAEAAKEADYMASLVRNLGLAARLEAGEPEPARRAVDLGALVARVAARHRPLAASSGVSLDFAVPEEAVLADGDETLLEQAVGNLVHNAVRHNGRGGHVAVALEAPRSPGGTFALTVADDGPGLPEDVLARLAAADDADHAARARTDPAGRVGLGLRIVRKVVARHGLGFTLRAREGGGLVAEIRGPRRPGP